MRLIHELASDSLPKVIKEGIKCDASGLKTDKTIQQTDEFLDKHIPTDLAASHISRQRNLYAYLVTDGAVIDIQDGRTIDTEEFIRRSKMAVVEIDAATDACYVSDLDVYDKLHAAVQQSVPDQELMRLAEAYWNALTPLVEFHLGRTDRPEVMITYDIPPDAIKVLKK